MNRAITFFLTGLLALLVGCGKPKTEAVPPGISWASLLAGALDLRLLAAPVEPSAAARMSSSCSDTSKVMLANLSPEIIGDMDHGFFSQVVDGPDGVTATLADFDGSGVITWIWSANPAGTLNLYIDGQSAPAVSMSFAKFLDGDFLPVKEPFASLTSLGHNLHFPIVHAHHCKLTVTVPRRADLALLYYQVAWQSLPPGGEIRPFDVTDIREHAGLLKQFARQLLDTSKSIEPTDTNGTTMSTVQCTLKPGREMEIYRAQGPQAITAIRFTGKSKSDLASLWFSGDWDGEPAVRLPLHMLAGVSTNFENTYSFPATVDGSRLFLRWFMPFATEGRLACTNTSDHDCTFTAEIWSAPVDISLYPLRFHANFQTRLNIPTETTRSLVLAETSGPGRFVGFTLNVDARSDKWWGEGDNIVWLDDTNHPAIHGTGTEDYFGFAWCSPNTFDHPFRAQTMTAHIGSDSLTAMHRYHLLDTLPFLKWGRFQFDTLGDGQGSMDWKTAVMWYSKNKQKETKATKM